MVYYIYHVPGTEAEIEQVLERIPRCISRTATDIGTYTSYLIIRPKLKLESL